MHNTMKSRTKSLFTLLITVLAVPAALAQVEIYRTIDDLLNKTPVVHEGFEYAGQSGLYKEVTLSFKNKSTGDKLKLECTEIWGFTYMKKFFRIVKPSKYWNENFKNFPVLLSSGSENGPFQWVVSNKLVEEVHKDKDRISLNPYYTSFVSASITGDLILAPIDDLGDGITKRIMAATRQFTTDHPELAWFFDCVKTMTEEKGERRKDVLRYHFVSSCINRMNENNE